MDVSIHRSLRTSGAMARHRNVLTRPERLDKLEREGRWNEEESVLGIPKVRSIKVTVKKKKKEEETVEAAAPESEAAPAANKGAAPE